MVSTSEADWTEYECPPTDVAAPGARAVSHRTPANTTTPRSVAVTSTAARLNELGHLLVDLESQLIGAAQQRTWEQCRHHWKQRVFSLTPGDDTCRRLSLLLLDLEASLLIDAQHESWIDTHRRHWVRRCKDLAGLGENLEEREDSQPRRTAPFLRLALGSYSVLTLGLFGGIRTDALRRIAEGGWDANGCRAWNDRIRRIMDDDGAEEDEGEPVRVSPIPADSTRTSLRSVPDVTDADVAADANDPSNDPFRLVPRREPNERDNAVARTQLAAVQFEREYLEGDLDDHDSFLGSDSISEPSDGLGPSSDDEEEERAANDRRGQLTNLTREILHESPHYRELVAHYRRRMGDPDYDPDASEEDEDPIRDALVAATVDETVRRREGDATAARMVTSSGHDGSHGRVTGRSTTHAGAVARRAARASTLVGRRLRPGEGAGDVIAAARDVYRAAGVPYPDSFPTAVEAAADVVNQGERAEGYVSEYDRRTGDFSRVTEAEVAPAVARPRIVPVLGDNSDIAPMNDTQLRAELAATRQKLEDAHDELLCQICFTERRDALIMPCLHMLYCRHCVDRTSAENERRGYPDRCPCCRESIGGVLRCKRL